MYIKCEFSYHGCIKTDKVCEISKHEKVCPFKKFSCHHPECMRETTKNELKKHNENCPFSNYICQEGCGKQMKLFEVIIFVPHFLFIDYIKIFNIKRKEHINVLNGYKI